MTGEVRNFNCLNASPREVPRNVDLNSCKARFQGASRCTPRLPNVELLYAPFQGHATSGDMHQRGVKGWSIGSSPRSGPLLYPNLAVFLNAPLINRLKEPFQVQSTPLRHHITTQYLQSVCYFHSITGTPGVFIVFSIKAVFVKCNSFAADSAGLFLPE